MQTTTNVSAILRGEQRSKRFTYRHSVTGAALEIGIPVSWIWFWLFAKWLKSKIWLRKVWVRLESVRKLFADAQAVRDASYATGEFLTSPEAAHRVVERWPDEYHQAKRAPQSANAEVVSLPVSNPVLCEEKAA